MGTPDDRPMLVPIDEWIARDCPPLALEVLGKDPAEMARDCPGALLAILGPSERTDYERRRDRFWDRVERGIVAASFKDGTAAWWLAESIVEQRERDREKARVAELALREVERVRAERAALSRGAGPTVDERASRYLATIDGKPGGAYRAALYLVRGFALDEGTALGLLVSEYAPRYHRKIARAELLGMVRRATKATQVGYGWMLEARR